MRTLIVEGWRSSNHSYALVNQRQLLHLRNDERFSLSHRDTPFLLANWSSIDSGLADSDKTLLAAIPSADPQASADIIYRISFPLRVHEGCGKVFVFGTSEYLGNQSKGMVGADGRADSVRTESVDIVTPSAWSRAGFLSCGFAPDRVHVLPHGVDLSLAQPRPVAERRAMRRALGIAEQAFAFLNIGAISWNKGIGPLIAAFAVHRRQYRDSILVLKGNEALYGRRIVDALAEAQKLRPEARDSDLLGSIRYSGRNLPLSELALLYSACDGYVAPYRAEAFNIPVLEAMAAGLPVIVTAGGATDDFCSAELALHIRADAAVGPSGGYLEPRIDSIVEQMACLISDPDGRAQRARGAADRAQSEYSWARVAGMLGGLLLGGP